MTPFERSSTESAGSQQLAESSCVEVAVADILPILLMADQAGILLPDVETRLDLDSTALQRKSGSMPLVDYLRVVAELSLSYSDESCHLSQRPLVLGTAQFILDQLAHCKTLRELFYKLAEMSNVLHGGSYNQIQESDGKISFIVDDSHFPYQIDQQRFLMFGAECALIVLHGLFDCVAAQEQLLPHPDVIVKRPQSVDAFHLCFWKSRLRYQGNHYVLAYDESIGRIPVKIPKTGLSNQCVFDHLVTLLQQPIEHSHIENIHIKVRRVLLNQLLDQQKVAEKLNMAVSTLRRKLADEGTNFRDVKQGVLKVRAKKMLDSGWKGCDVADALGFSDLRSFSRAFKQWYNITLSEYLSQSENSSS